jgi:hypothetical protein
MAQKTSSTVDLHQRILEINKKISNAKDVDSALSTAAEELKKALEAERIQIILHRPEPDSK